MNNFVDVVSVLKIPDDDYKGVILFYEDYIGIIEDGEEMSEENISISIGDSRELRFHLRNQDNNVVPSSNVSSSEFIISEKENGTSTLTINGVVGVDSIGELIFPINSSTLEERQYYYKTLVIISGKQYTISKGLVNIN